ncbi:DUF1016 N-terminal domain-containing protein [Hallella faecis]|uniref:DUF1016 N-terminal domain-containing protein n=1 Tax=Hallella faecis TaxID=2841596 RepID=UPI003F9254ED
MEQNIIQTDVVKAAAAIKSAIQLTRKTMMLSANKNALALYYGIGRYICQSQKRSSWGDKILETISAHPTNPVEGCADANPKLLLNDT